MALALNFMPSAGGQYRLRLGFAVKQAVIYPDWPLEAQALAFCHKPELPVTIHPGLLL
jgi:hypothetical protein